MMRRQSAMVGEIPAACASDRSPPSSRNPTRQRRHRVGIAHIARDGLDVVAELGGHRAHAVLVQVDEHHGRVAAYRGDVRRSSPSLGQHR